MPISATCPHCRTPHRLADELDGRLIRCKECGEPFRVGGRRRSAEVDDDRPGGQREEDDFVNDRPRRRRSSSSSSSALVLLMVIGVVLGIGVTIIGGAAVWYLMSGRSPRQGPQIVGQRPNAGVILPNRGGVIADHTIFPPRPAGVGRPAEVPEGEITVTLANPRRVDGIPAGRPTFQVDYEIAGELPKRGKETYHLVTKVPEGIADTVLRFQEGQAQGTVSFAFLPGHDPGAKFEVWVEREPFGKPKERVRVSKPLTVD